ncbi:Urease accessory protein UreF [BD1-7 clade bacterium]|uniref:Urease accessory protein UreF n=1 Tax=BD1-7 clade bacterium TaxID=2029982 RepID=A0A5S9QW42_9GAMM|nr:Urease accessory protein UreF [BD1-7 clade bacterium]CAA0122840.1 Urease accessory protein UreF [BD1-7 clade bacterium]
MTDPALSKLNRILQLASANLPVGSFTFSQGLETAIESQVVTGVQSCEQWIQSAIDESIAVQDLPVIKRMMAATHHRDSEQLNYWNDYLLASRETRELLLTDTMTGRALLRLLHSLDDGFGELEALLNRPEVSYCTAYAMAAAGWHIPYSSALYGFVWAYLDAQLAAATKLIPLGQTDNQTLLLRMGDRLDVVVDRALELPDQDIGGSLFLLALASSWHETQYSRLFRS